MQEFEILALLFGPSGMGKSSLIQYATTGKRPEPNPTTAYYVPFSMNVPFFACDWERVSKKMFGKTEAGFVDIMMSGAYPSKEKALRQAYLESCNRNVAEADESARIPDRDEDFMVVSFKGPDTGGQPRYEIMFNKLANYCKEYAFYPCFRNQSGSGINTADLGRKIGLIDAQLGPKWKGAYLQLQNERDPTISPEQKEGLSALKDLPIHSVSSKTMDRYEIIDLFVIQACSNLPFIAKA